MMESKESYRKQQENELEVIQVSKSVTFNIVMNLKINKQTKNEKEWREKSIFSKIVQGICRNRSELHFISLFYSLFTVDIW